MVSESVHFVRDFSPSLEFFAVATGDGGVQIWDTATSSLHWDLANIEGIGPIEDYTCAKFVLCNSKKKNKQKEVLLLALGSAVGDVIALNVKRKRLQWRTDGCHSGGVKAFSAGKDGVLYSSGADGMVCKLDCKTGEILPKFRASKKEVSCLAISSDGETLATASTDLKLFSLTDNRMIRKLTGHSGRVRAMVFTEDNVIISSASGENHIAVWTSNGNKKKSTAFSVLSMEKPAIELDCKSFRNDAKGLSVLAVSEGGTAYLWHSQSLSDLNYVKPSQLTVSSQQNRCFIFSARLHAIENDESLGVFIAYGNLLNLKFERAHIKKGENIVLPGSNAEILSSSGYTPSSDLHESKGEGKQSEKASKKRRAKFDMESNLEDDGVISTEINGSKNLQSCKSSEMITCDDNEPTMEERLLQAEMKKTAETKGPETDKENSNLHPDKAMNNKETGKDNENSMESSQMLPPNADSLSLLLTRALQSEDTVLLEECLKATEQKVIRNSVSRLHSTHAFRFLKYLLYRLKLKPTRAVTILPWLRAILLHHASYLMEDSASLDVLNSLYQIMETRISLYQPTIRLSARLDLISSQMSLDTIKEDREQPPICGEDGVVGQKIATFVDTSDEESD